MPRGISNDLPTVPEVIERIGFGWAQLRAVLCGGGVFLADGAELLLIGTVTRAVSKEWTLGSTQRGLVVSVVFLGVLLGNGVSGPLSDSWGRKIPIVLSYSMVAFFSVLSACAVNFWMLCGLRLVVGLSFGLGLPAWSALATEISPQRWRIPMQVGSQLLFVFGEVYSALLVWWCDPQMRNLDWRWLLVAGAVPSAVLGVLCVLLLYQSPSFLAVHGQYDSAKQVLEAMQLQNGKGTSPIEFQPPVACASAGAMEAMRRQMGVVFGRHLLYSTITMIFSCFVLNIVFYGCLYAFPQVVADVHMGDSPAASLIIGALFEIPGYGLALAWCMWLPRKAAIMFYLFSITICAVSFTVGATFTDSHFLMYYLLQSGYLGIKVFTCIGFTAVYQYSVEIYPTVARSTGQAMCVGGGRIGSMLAPLYFEWLVDRTGSFSWFFYSIAVLCVFNFVLVFLLPNLAGKGPDDAVTSLNPLMKPKAVDP